MPRYEVNHGRRRDMSDIERAAVLAAYVTLESMIKGILIDAHCDRDDDVMLSVYRRRARRHAMTTRQLIRAFADCKPFQHKQGCLCIAMARSRAAC